MDGAVIGLPIFRRIVVREDSGLLEVGFVVATKTAAGTLGAGMGVVFLDLVKGIEAGLLRRAVGDLRGHDERGGTGHNPRGRQVFLGVSVLAVAGDAAVMFGHQDTHLGRMW